MRRMAAGLVCLVLAMVWVGAEGVAWSEQTGLNALMYAYAAYCPANEVNGWSCRYCGHHETDGFRATHSIVNASTNTYAFVGVDQNTGTAVMSFRGTVMKSIKNWVSDLESVHLEPYPAVAGAKVAHGFLNAFNSVRSQVVAAVTDVERNARPARWLVTGHSLGAALSVWGALEIQTLLPGARVDVVNFGGPRVGNAAFAAYWEQKVGGALRMTWKADIVPHVPPMALGFHHIGTEVWGHVPHGTTKIEHKVCDGSGEDRSCSDSVKIPRSVFDHLHYMGIYESCSSASGGSSGGSSGTRALAAPASLYGATGGGGRGAGAGAEPTGKSAGASGGADPQGGTGFYNRTAASS